MCRVKNPTSHKGNDRITKCEHGKAPTRQKHCDTHCCLWSGLTSKQKLNHWRCQLQAEKAGTRCPSPSYERFLKEHSSPFMRLAEHLTALRVGASNVCLVGETRRAPSRHSRDARVYGHTTTAMHKLSTPAPHTH